MSLIFVTIGESIHNKKLVGEKSSSAMMLDENLMSPIRLLTALSKKSLLMRRKKILKLLSNNMSEILSKSAFLSESFHP